MIQVRGGDHGMNINNKENKYSSLGQKKSTTTQLTAAAAGEIESTEVTKQAPPNSCRLNDSPQGCIAMTSLFSFKALTPTSGGW